jgi:hypothetical protein
MHEWLSAELFEEALAADEKEMECMHRLRRRKAKVSGLKLHQAATQGMA